jgi:signal transduction histidine kinase
VVRQVVESLGPVAAAAGVRLDSALDAPALHVVGDVLRLQQIFSNLIVNAVKFTPAGGTVSVQFDRRPTAVRVSVTDTGVGIEPDLLPYVFEPFRRSERAHGADGLGLGLAIVRDLVELHGGVVQASSAGSGRGASFVVELPLAGSEPERRHAPVSASS